MRSRVMIWKQMNGCSYPGFSDRQHCFPILVQFFVFGLVLVEILLRSGSRWKWAFTSKMLQEIYCGIFSIKVGALELWFF
ncbi:unnamed protein product [Victoria cruziana]